MFVMQTSAMKTCFQIAECSFSYAKLSNISVTSKYLNEINIIIGQILLNPPSCFLKRDGGFFLSYNYLSSKASHHGKTRLDSSDLFLDNPITYRPLCAVIIYTNLKQTLTIGRIWNQISLFEYHH